MASIFTKIINGEIACHKIAEDEKYFAFLDIRPVCIGHTLVIPKQEVDNLFDLESDMLAEMMVFAQKIAKAQEKAIDCKKVGVAVLGLEVPHAHIHLCPLKSERDINFSKPKLEISDDELKSIAQKIKENL